MCFADFLCILTEKQLVFSVTMAKEATEFRRLHKKGEIAVV